MKIIHPNKFSLMLFSCLAAIIAHLVTFACSADTLPNSTTLKSIGELFNYYFTLEVNSNVNASIFMSSPLPVDIHQIDRESLLMELPKYLKGYHIKQDPINSTVIHIIENTVNDNSTDALEQSLHNVKFDGTTNQLLSYLNKQGVKISEQRSFTVGDGPIRADESSKIKISASNIKVRDLLSCIADLTRYNRILWISNSKEDGTSIINYQGVNNL